MRNSLWWAVLSVPAFRIHYAERGRLMVNLLKRTGMAIQRNGRPGSSSCVTPSGSRTTDIFKFQNGKGKLDRAGRCGSQSTARTRLESISQNRTPLTSLDRSRARTANPFRVVRSSLADGPGDRKRTDRRTIPLRSRVRFGLGGDGPLRFLFEGQDSRPFSMGTARFPGYDHGQRIRCVAITRLVDFA